MKGFLQNAKEGKYPIEVIYMSSKGELTQRTVIIKEISEEVIKVYCLAKQKPRSFKRSNILSAVKVRNIKGVSYA